MGSWRVSEAQCSHDPQAQKAGQKTRMLFMSGLFHGIPQYATYVDLIASGSKVQAEIFSVRWQVSSGIQVGVNIGQLVFTFFMSCGESRRRATRTADHQIFGTCKRLRLASLALL